MERKHYTIKKLTRGFILSDGKETMAIEDFQKLKQAVLGTLESSLNMISNPSTHNMAIGVEVHINYPEPVEG